MVVLNGNKNQKVIAYKGDREPVKVFYRPKGALAPVLQEKVSYKPKTSDTPDNSIAYSSEYKKNLLNMSFEGNTIQPTRSLIPLFDMNWQKVEETGIDGETLVSYFITIPSDVVYEDNITFSAKKIGIKVDGLFVSLTKDGSWFSGTITDSIVYFGDITPKNSADFYDYFDAIYVNKYDGSDFDITEFTNNYQLVITQPCNSEFPPTPSTPAEIENSTNVSAELSGYNLAYCSKDNDFIYQAKSEILSNNSFRVATTGTTATTRGVTYNIPVTPNTTVRVSFNYKRNYDVVTRVVCWATSSITSFSGDFLTQYSFSTNTEGSVSSTVTTGNTNYLGILIYLCEEKEIPADAEILITDLMVTYGEEQKPFQPYFAPTKVDIPSEVTSTTDKPILQDGVVLADGTVVPLRFAKLGNYADKLVVDGINKKVIYQQQMHRLIITGEETGWYKYQTADDGVRIAIEGLKLESTFKPKVKSNNVVGFLCNYLQEVDGATKTIGIAYYNSNDVYWWAINLGQADLNSTLNKLKEFKANGNPLYVQYRLETSIEYNLTNTDLGQQLLSLANNTQNATNIINISADVPVSNLNVDFAIWGGRDENLS